jgi:hypothetical protein
MSPPGGGGWGTALETVEYGGYCESKGAYNSTDSNSDGAFGVSFVVRCGSTREKGKWRAAVFSSGETEKNRGWQSHCVDGIAATLSRGQFS